MDNLANISAGPDILITSCCCPVFPNVFYTKLRVKFVEKPNISINFSQSIHNNSGVTAAWFFENTRYWLLPFTKIYLRIRSIWLFREVSKHFVHELVITLEFCQNSWRAVNFSLLWLVEKYDWYSHFLNVIVAFSQQCVSSWLLFLLQSY